MARPLHGPPMRNMLHDFQPHPSWGPNGCQMYVLSCFDRNYSCSSCLLIFPAAPGHPTDLLFKRPWASCSNCSTRDLLSWPCAPTTSVTAQCLQSSCSSPVRPHVHPQSTATLAAILSHVRTTQDIIGHSLWTLAKPCWSKFMNTVWTSTSFLRTIVDKATTSSWSAILYRERGIRIRSAIMRNAMRDTR